MTIALVGGGHEPVNRVDLEQVGQLYQQYSSERDLGPFITALNEKKLYPPGDPLLCAWTEKGASVTCYVDKNANATYDDGVDDKVFKIEALREGPRTYLVFGDGYHYYRHSLLGDIATWYLVDAMFRNHYVYYGGWHYYPYVWVTPGYYHRSYGVGGRGGGRTRGGGWGGGK